MTRSCAIRGATLVTLDPEVGVVPDGLLVMEDGRIREVGENPGADPRADGFIDGRGLIALPGFVNAHMHTRPVRALGDELPVPEWHARYADGISVLMDDEDSRKGALLAFSECLLAGYTSALAMPVKPHGCFRGAVEIGIRAGVAPHTADQPLIEGSCDTIEDNARLIETCGVSANERVHSWLGFDILAGCSDGMIRGMRQTAGRFGVRIHGHMSEHRGEVGYALDRWGKRPPAALEDLGLLGPDLVLAHCVKTDRDDIETLARTDTKVVHNPVSNMKFGSGGAPVAAMLEAGVTVALGTDGMLSTYRLDPFETMRQALNLQRLLAEDATALLTEKALEMTTLHGNRALGFDGGRLRPGLNADVVLIDSRRLQLTPRARGTHDNLIALLVWSASAADVDTVIVNGTVAVRNRTLTLVDEEVVRREAQEASDRLLERLIV